MIQRLQPGKIDPADITGCVIDFSPELRRNTRKPLGRLLHDLAIERIQPGCKIPLHKQVFLQLFAHGGGCIGAENHRETLVFTKDREIPVKILVNTRLDIFEDVIQPPVDAGIDIILRSPMLAGDCPVQFVDQPLAAVGAGPARIDRGGNDARTLTDDVRIDFAELERDVKKRHCQDDNGQKKTAGKSAFRHSPRTAHLALVEEYTDSQQECGIQPGHRDSPQQEERPGKKPGGHVRQAGNDQFGKMP